MENWFAELADIQDPSREELALFVRLSTDFMNEILQNEDQFGFLWEDDPELLNEARETFEIDILRSSSQLAGATQDLSDEALFAYGLSGRSARFKFRVLNSITKRWPTIQGHLTVRGWLKQVFDAIDAALDSLIAATGGVGGALKEFKDALSALVKTR